jgi:phosphatidylglycerol:prolipoprotein diacylglycerol transferase
MSLLATLPYWTLGPWHLAGPLTIYSFGLFVAIGLLLCFQYTSWRAEKKYGIAGEEFQNFAFFLVIIGWPLSHVFNVLFYEPFTLKTDPMELFRFWGSISSYGGLLGGLIGFTIWKVRNPKRRGMIWSDMAVFGLVVPWFFGRIGCASVHDHPGDLVYGFGLWEWLRPIVGGPELWPLAIDFPARVNLPAGPRHDLGFYEAIWWGLILVIIVILDRKPRRLGFFSGIIPMLYAPGRFMFDFLRVPPEMGGDARYYGLTPAQYMSVGIFFLGLGLLVWSRKQPVVEWREFDPKNPSAPGEVGLTPKADAAAAAAALAETKGVSEEKDAEASEEE